MPRKIGYGRFTPARRAALKKAALISARKRRKHKSETRKRRKVTKKQLGAAAAAGIAIGGAATAPKVINFSSAYKEGNSSKKLQSSELPSGKSTFDSPLRFDTSTPEGKAEAVAYGKSMTKQIRTEWYKTAEGKKQFDTIRDYTSHLLDVEIGNHLRVPEKTTPTPEKALEGIKTLDAAFESEFVTPVPEWTEVVRGSSLADFLGESDELDALIHKHQLIDNVVENVDSIREALQGKTFSNPSYTSTSLDKEPSDWFKDVGKVHISFRLPPGTRALYVANSMVDQYKNIKVSGQFLSKSPYEKEVILKRGTRYKVHSVDAVNGKIKVVVEVLNND